MDEEFLQKLEQLEKTGEEEEIYPEHEFIASCLNIGLSLQDLKELTYIDVLKILYVYLEKNKQKKKIKKATQSDWDRLAGGL